MLDKLRAIPVPALAFCTVLSLFSVILRADNAFYRHLESLGAVNSFLWSMLAGAAAICFLLAIPLKLTATQSRATRTVAAFGLTFTLFGLAFSLFAPQPLIAGVAGGLLLGSGLITLLAEWLLRLPAATVGDGDSLLISTTFILLASSLLWALFIFFDNPSVSAAGAFVLAIVGSLPLLLPGKDKTVEAHFDDTSNGAANTTASTASVATTDRPAASQTAISTIMPMRRIMVQSWSAIFGLVFNLLTLGLTFHPAVAGMGAASFSFKPLAYLVILAVLLIITILRSQPTNSGAVPTLLCRILLPVGTAIMLASPFMEGLIPLDALPGLGSLPYVGVGLLYLVGLNTLIALVRLDRDRALPLIASTLFFCCAGMAIGVVVFSLLGKNAQIFSLCLLSLFFVALVITALYEAGDKQREVAVETATTAQNLFLENCQTFAQRFDLSPREAEILVYLARGRGSIWVGKQLNISPETVRTHCKRIYEKTGIHNKEDLIDAVEHST
ncbi:MAG: helix-turn-helix transcriptional regulator [Coriobacteriales bacterium]|jgi:DNA-binding CsgD family transcriptional regulator|nr:helix-turn-helix transcriptional regulator [Coriobacteriales bacterium]